MGSNNVNRKQLEKMAEAYGVGTTNKKEYSRKTLYTPKSDEELGKDIAGRLNMKYDVRRSLEAAQGEKGKIARSVSGINAITNADEALRVHNFLHDTHEKKLGNTGKFSSANDYGNVTNYWVNNDRTSLSKQNRNKSPKPKVQYSKNPVDLRRDTAEANQIIENYNAGLISGGGLTNNSIQRFAGIGSDDKAAGFLSDYSLNVRNGMKNVGMSTRGPASGSTTVQPDVSSAPVPQANKTTDEFTEQFKSGIKSNLVKA